VQHGSICFIAFHVFCVYRFVYRFVLGHYWSTCLLPALAAGAEVGKNAHLWYRFDGKKVSKVEDPFKDGLFFVSKYVTSKRTQSTELRVCCHLVD
jgi:hypothetical protein